MGENDIITGYVYSPDLGKVLNFLDMELEQNKVNLFNYGSIFL